ncbi:MAG: hypothetical protein QM736_08250 [Vicinamibacterales bacterium]
MQTTLEQFDERQHPVVQRNRNVVLARLEIRFDGARQFRAGRRRHERGGHREQLVDRRRVRLLLREAVALRQRFHLVRADAIDQTVELLAKPRFGATAIGRLNQDVDRHVELLTRTFDVASFELGLAGFEVAIGLGDEGKNGIFDGNSGEGRGLGRGERRRRTRWCRREWRLAYARAARSHEWQQCQHSESQVWASNHSGALRNRASL